MYRLVHLNGESRGRRQVVHRQRMLAGSDLGCILWIGDPGVPPKLAELVFESDGALHVRTLSDAPESVLVNGQAVAEARLSNRDLLTLGPRRFRVELRTAGAAARWYRAVALSLLALALVRPALRSLRPQPAEPDPLQPEHGREGPLPLRETFSREAPALDEMEVLDQWIEEAAARVTGRPAGESPPPVPAHNGDPEDTLVQERLLRAHRVLDFARDAAGRQQFDEAHRLLDRLQQAVPDFLPAHAERARLYERQGRAIEAERHWLRVLRHGAETPLFGEAAEALNRIAVFESPAEEPPPLRAPAGPAPSPDPQSPVAPATADARIRIARTEPVRFPGTGEFDEMRILRLTLTGEGAGAPRQNVFLEVHIYDRWLPSGQIRPTDAVMPRGRIPIPDGPWPPDGKTVAVSYVVPAGHRERQRRQTGQRSEYAGFVARVYVGDALVEQVARPTALLTINAASP